jgi:hypothetical protein
MSEKWNNTNESLPEEGVVVKTMNSSGDVTELVRKGSLWFFSDMSMYVYYVPQMWSNI